MRTSCIAQGSLLHFTVKQKLTQHCKTTIPLLKKETKKEKRNERGEIPTNMSEIQKLMRILWHTICQQIRQPRIG